MAKRVSLSSAAMLMAASNTSGAAPFGVVLRSKFRKRKKEVGLYPRGEVFAGSNREVQWKSAECNQPGLDRSRQDTHPRLYLHH